MTPRRTTATRLLLAALLSTLSSVCHALYDDVPYVQTFTSAKEFRDKVTDSRSVILLQFYAPWCGHCQQFKPYYSKLAEILDGIVTVAAVDASSDGPMKRVAGEYGVSGFPTLKIVRPRGGGQKSEVRDLNTRDPNEIANLVVQAVQDTIHDRAGTPASGRSSGSGGGGGGGGGSAAIELNSGNFDKFVYQNPEVVAVAFIAPWCGHCKQLLPEWNDAAEVLSGSGATLAVVDATVETSLASEYGVQGFPTIKIFPGGAKSGSRDASDYQGGRTKEQIVSYVLAEVDRTGAPKEIPELVGPAVLEETCGSGKTLCVFAALPHILDTGAEGRNKYRDIITAASKAVRGMPFEFLWFEGGNAQGKLESALELTFGFPAVAAYSKEKGVYAVHRGSFTEANLRKFLMGITAGKVGTYQMRDELIVVETDPWDGKDGEPIEEESLADIMGWDGDEDGGDEL
mmetsp:Transcript_52253/g.111043  ORF Transcript_52253/g.111043 Transcript_52253/m.111043 type:complete len:457 (-) Transcript_52253:171-1541(-)|eukprot:CAMPEP_0172551934 /NCGR_PEP_ID=MMETSP1067-20121228/42408_1 /TAXON_ID=265564 ORGANISM="Thalassiosira punctigera, Strain Tpunct2005C2" /NCGR_SAMPLE_ID=MMETSP1067 /ASSEMBLY_ACC=CAM_ASM_000444 /LENGTH=456 /DNA_ID=CAMNT_0013339811 /DNA_START=54 /DNA_END=1424 /DNA_ORIENTATION=+